jgi:hypothetical protein
MYRSRSQWQVTTEQPFVTGSLADLYPEEAAEWDSELNAPLTATMITPGSKKKVGWVCRKCQRKWQARINSRTRGGHGVRGHVTVSTGCHM